MKSWTVIAVLAPVVLALYTAHYNRDSLTLPSELPNVLKNAFDKLNTADTPTQQAAAIANSLDKGTCQLQGTVDECCNCTYNAVDQLNQKHVYPVVSELVKTAFFRYFKVNIYCDCPLWPDDSMCALRSCSVCECDDAEVPKPWRQAEDTSSCQAKRKEDCTQADCALHAMERESKVDKSIAPAVKQQLLAHAKGWRGINNPWMAEGESEEEFQYINLLVNPERYTGYKGEHAHRIWSAIYNQSCFTDGVTCTEERVFHRLISGMHTSITIHLVNEWLLDEDKGIWGPNLEEFDKRLGAPEHKDRVQNLYFAYLFVLRAVLKAAPLLNGYDYATGLQEEDAMTKNMVKQLLLDQAIKQACPMPFDEGRMWKGENAAELKEQLQHTFRNITRVMDCVGCEKCKLWGKLQTLGVATALKILFSARDCQGSTPGADEPFAELQLERNEAIALVNLLARFSNSLQTYHRLSAAVQQQSGRQPSLSAKEAVV